MSFDLIMLQLSYVMAILISTAQHTTPRHRMETDLV